MKNKNTPTERETSDKQTDQSTSHVSTCSPLPLYRDLSSMLIKDSWVIETASLIADSNLTPGLDIVLSLKRADGILNDLCVSLRIPRELDTPRIIEGRSMSYLASIKWGETQIMDGVLFSFRRPDFLAELFIDAATHMDSLGKIILENAHVLRGMEE